MRWGLGKLSLIVWMSAPALFPATSAQESFPSQNVKLVVAFPAGGPTDAIARIIGQRLGEKWGRASSSRTVVALAAT